MTYAQGSKRVIKLHATHHLLLRRRGLHISK